MSIVSSPKLIDTCSIANILFAEGCGVQAEFRTHVFIELLVTRYITYCVSGTLPCVGIKC
jgi:hypothetical protein